MKIGGESWQGWANVAHQLVSERQSASRLLLSYQQMQKDAYLRELGLQQQADQFDRQMEHRGREQQRLSDQFEETQALSMLREARMVEGMKLDQMGKQARDAITMGITYDPNTRSARPLREGDMWYSEHQQYQEQKKKGQDATLAATRKLRAIESQLNRITREREDLSGQIMAAEIARNPTPEAVSALAALRKRLDGVLEEEGQLKQASRALTASMLGNAYMDGADSEEDGTWDELKAAVKGAGFQAPEEKGGGWWDRLKSGREAIAKGTEPFGLSAMRPPPKTLPVKVQIGGMPYQLKEKYKDRVQRDLVHLNNELAKANKAGDQKAIDDILKKKRFYWTDLVTYKGKRVPRIKAYLDEAPSEQPGAPDPFGKKAPAAKGGGFLSNLLEKPGSELWASGGG